MQKEHSQFVRHIPAWCGMLMVDIGNAGDGVKSVIKCVIPRFQFYLPCFSCPLRRHLEAI